MPLFAQVFWEQMADFSTASPKLLPAVRTFLATAHAAGVLLGVVTSNRSYIARNALAACGVDSLFSYYVGSDIVPNQKPSPDPVFACLQGLGLPISPDTLGATLFVGDSASDVGAALAAGVGRTAWVVPEEFHARRIDTVAQFDQSQFDWFSSVAELQTTLVFRSFPKAQLANNNSD
jgi:phosphoglycolate phosphatase-like HAD superfamily hydrolase